MGTTLGRAPSRDAYVERVLQQNTGPHGVFGAIVMWSYFERMLQMLQEIPEYKDLTGARLSRLSFANQNTSGRVDEIESSKLSPGP